MYKGQLSGMSWPKESLSSECVMSQGRETKSFSRVGHGTGDEAGEPGRPGRGQHWRASLMGGSYGLAKGDAAGLLTHFPACPPGRYAVFGLGSSMYPQFCAFAHDIDQKLSHLGASQLTPTGEGDELSGQEEAFRGWAVQTFKVSSQPELPLSTAGRLLCTGAQDAVLGIPGGVGWPPAGYWRRDPGRGLGCSPTAPRRAVLEAGVPG